LSNAVAVMAYEVLRQHGFPGLKQHGPSVEKDGAGAPIRRTYDPGKTHRRPFQITRRD
jgi:hypothetical protein